MGKRTGSSSETCQGTGGRGENATNKYGEESMVEFQQIETERGGNFGQRRGSDKIIRETGAEGGSLSEKKDYRDYPANSG